MGMEAGMANTVGSKQYAVGRMGAGFSTGLVIGFCLLLTAYC